MTQIALGMPGQHVSHGWSWPPVLDEGRLYRYALGRWWRPGDRVCWIMLNPSTATADDDDPTVTRCAGFSRRWGFGSLEVLNLFALRSTDPRGLLEAGDPVGPDNDLWIAERTRPGECSLVVCAWGQHPGPVRRLAEDRLAVVAAALEGHPRVRCLGRCKEGAPRHPVRLPYAAELQPFRPRPS